MSSMMADKTEEFEPFTMISPEGRTAAGIMGRLRASKEWLQGKHAGVRPWAEFVNVKNISRPKGTADMTRRMLHNLQRFQSNYLFVFLGLVIYCIVTNPTLLFAIAFCLSAWWFISIKNQGENISLFGRETSAKELYAAVVVIAIPLFYFAGAGTAVFWIIGASVVVILLHAVAMAIPEQIMDEEVGVVMEDISAS